MSDAELQNPYPGLRPFREEESHLFFGREGQSEAILTLLQRERFAAVVGVSGCGKSSLVKAGLVPVLHSGLFPSRHSEWKITSMRPGSTPILNLARELVAAGITLDGGDGPVDSVALLDASLRRSSRGLGDIMEQAALANRVGEIDFDLLIVIDQFEELFRYGSDIAPEELEQFVRLFIEAVRMKNWPIHCIITMRSDFLGDCSRFRDLPELINRAEYLVPRMTREERREAISGPASLEGVDVSPRLLNCLLDDMGDDPDQLPVMQHALRQAWVSRAKRNDVELALDLQDYREAGTLKGALSKHAGDAFHGKGENGLATERQREIAEILFRTTTQKGDDNRGVRRPTKLGRISEIAEADLGEMIEVIDVFRDPERSFLMPPAGEPLDEESLIDISHESLMRNWEILKGWVDAEGKDADDYGRLLDSAERWQEGNAEPLNDLELERMREVVGSKVAIPAWCHLYATPEQAALAWEFWKESLAASEQRRIEKKRQEQKERAREEKEITRKEEAKRTELERANKEAREKLARRQKQLFGGVAIILALSGVVVWALKERRDAREKEGQALEANEVKARVLEDLEVEKVRTQSVLASSFSRSIGQNDDSEFAEPEIEALWDLAELGPDNQRVRKRYLDLSWAGESNTEQFSRRIGQALLASTGLSTELRLHCYQRAMECLKSDQSIQHRIAAGRIAVLFKEYAATTAPEIVSQLSDGQDLEAIVEFSKQLGRLGDRLPAEAVATGAKMLIERMVEEKNSDNLSQLGTALGGLGDQLPADVAVDGAEILIERKAREKDSDTKGNLGAALEGIGGKLPADMVAAIAKLLTARMATEKDSENLYDLGVAVGGFGSKLPVELVTAGAKALTERMAIEKDLRILSRLGTALGSLGNKLPADAAADGAKVIAGHMATEKSFLRLSYLASALEVLGEKLSADAAGVVATGLAERMTEEKGAVSLVSLGSAMEVLGKKLTSEVADAVAKMLSERMITEKDSLCLYTLGATLGSIGEKLPAATTAYIAGMLTERMATEKELDKLTVLGSALGGLGDQLPAEAAAFAAKILTEWIVTEKNDDRLVGLGSALGRLGHKLRIDEFTTGMEMLLERFHGSVNSESREELAEALAEFGARLPSENIVEVLWVLLPSMSSSEEDFDQTTSALLTHLESKQDLGQLLKNPFCTGVIQKAVLAELEERFANEERDVHFHGEIAELIRQGEELGLDLESPPRRPEFLRK